MSQSPPLPKPEGVDALDLDETRVWRFTKFTRCFCWAVIVLGISAIIALPVSAVVAGGGDAFIPASILAGIAAMWALTAWRHGVHPAIIATPEQLIVRNPWKTYTLDWEEIRDCQAGYSGIMIAGRDGQLACAWAIQEANLSRWLGRHTRADEVAEYLTARSAAIRRRRRREGR